ncbi:MAG: hypothetical protein M3Z05_20835 [Gemmatimonadota bacterium]|nr:hypothetical protein [Gemmatimonadota bacterium]
MMSDGEHLVERLALSPDVSAGMGVDVQPAALRVVIITCFDPPWACADALLQHSACNLLAVVSTPYKRPASLVRRVRNVYRYHGVLGMARLAVARLAGRRGDDSTAYPALMPGKSRPPHLRFRDFHDDDCLAAIRALAPDVIVVDGTYILRPSLFDISRIVTLNLHSGRVPDYRGAPPAFWEIIKGETEVGITVHAVTAKVDEGPIYLERSVALPVARIDDPLVFARRFWREVLRPEGLRLMAHTLDSIAAGTARPRVQPKVALQTNRAPTKSQLRKIMRSYRVRQNSD